MPMMADPRKAEDHVHILTGPDMRFFEQDCTAYQDFTERVGELVASVITHRKQAYGDHALPTPELEDILKTLTFASRCKTALHPDCVGDFIWMTWETKISGGRHGPYMVPKDRNPDSTRVGTGNFFFTITTRAARKFMKVLAVFLVVQKALAVRI